MDLKEGWCPDCKCLIPVMEWQGMIVFQEHAASDGPFLCEETLKPVNFDDEAAYLAHLQRRGLAPV